MSEPALEDAPPQTGGWAPLHAADFGAFEALTGTLYWTKQALEPGEPYRIGLRISQKHCNAANVCHGGMMATFMDMALGLTMRASIDAAFASPTMTLSVDYLGAAALGDWIESRTRLVHATYKTCFCDGMALSPRGPVARANAIFRVSRPKPAA